MPKLFHKKYAKNVPARLLQGIVCLLFCFLLSGCGSKPNPGSAIDNTADTANNSPKVNNSCIEEIRQKGRLTAGCKTDVPGLSFYDKETDTWSGLETELAYQTAAKIFQVSIQEARQKNLVEFVGVTVADREEKLENGDVDCLFATYTITNERKQKFAFSESYYTDYIGLMVKTTGDNPNSLGSSDIKSIANLDGKYIGVPKKATTRQTFLNYIDTMNNIKTAPIFLEYDSYEALFQALKKGDIDVMAVDVSILNGYVDASTVILNDRFGGQHYGAAVKKENMPLLDYINEAIGA